MAGVLSISVAQIEIMTNLITRMILLGSGVPDFDINLSLLDRITG